MLVPISQAATWKSSQPMGAAVVVVVGCGGVVVVVVGLGSGGQGHVARSGWVGPLVQPSQLGHVTRDITEHVTRDT